MITALQAMSAFLDLAGVLLIGLVTSIALSSGTSSALPESLSRALSAIGLETPMQPGTTVLLALLAALLLVSKTLVSFWLNRVALHFLALRESVASTSLVSSLLSRPLSILHGRSSQETAYVMTTGVAAAVQTVLGQGVVIATETAVLGVLTIGLLLTYPQMTLFSVLFFGLVAIIVYRVLSERARNYGQESADSAVESIVAIQEVVNSFRELFVLDRREAYVERIRLARQRAARVTADVTVLNLLSKQVFEVMLVVGAILLTTFLVVTEGIDRAIPTLVVFLVASARVVPSMLRLQTAQVSIRVASGQIALLFDLQAQINHSALTLPLRPSGALPNVWRPGFAWLDSEGAKLGNQIACDAVCFTYPGTDRPALHDISLEVSPGSSVAIVGPSGAGKSTFADIILGVLKPDSGNVLIGGRSTQTVIQSWPGSIGYVPQHVFLSNGTIRSNIALGLPEDGVDDDLVWNALERAHLADYLRTSGRGLDTLVGEHGVRLSGGQRQRIGLARALYTHPAVLILDEATSALDADTEHGITGTLAGLEGDVTRVVIAHRLATIRKFPLVVYLESGNVLAQGSFDAVRASVPQFDRQARILGL